MFSFFKDKSFLYNALTIAIPVAIQNIINTSINLMDTLMVATLDADSVAAVGLCNGVFTLWNTVSFGVISGGMVLCSQFVGAKRYDALRRAFFLTILFDFVCSLIFFLPSRFATREVMSFLTDGPMLINCGERYLKIVCLIYPLQAITLSIMLILRCLGKVKMAIVSSIVTLFSNVTLNYLLINGHCGFPALGVEGAAIATLCSRLIETALLTIYLFASKSVLILNFDDIKTSFNLRYLKIHFKHVLGTVGDELVYGIGSMLYVIAFGRLSAEEVSAVSIAMVLHNMLLTFFIGLGSACSVILGIELGQNKIEKAKLYAKYFLQFCVFLDIVLGIITLLGKNAFKSLYSNLGTDVLFYLDRCIYVVILLLIAGTISYILLVGILRSGGDIKSAVVIDFITAGLMGLPFAFISIMVFKMPVYIAFCGILIEEAAKTIFGYIRYKKYEWANNIVINI